MNTVLCFEGSSKLQAEWLCSWQLLNGWIVPLFSATDERLPAISIIAVDSGGIVAWLNCLSSI
ncbi:MAG: hypothetical protein H6557_16065 [Lewinellaceae bacterium]|nr:hypothetical protein [Phaeodactylibacter sp.]MCB9038132.1 hypothetical protein [Lewinellaceae bacterium]